MCFFCCLLESLDTTDWNSLPLWNSETLKRSPEPPLMLDWVVNGWTFRFKWAIPLSSRTLLTLERDVKTVHGKFRDPSARTPAHPHPGTPAPTPAPAPRSTAVTLWRCEGVRGSALFRCDVRSLGESPCCAETVLQRQTASTQWVEAQTLGQNPDSYYYLMNPSYVVGLK